MKLYDWDSEILLGTLIISSFIVYLSYQSYKHNPQGIPVTTGLDQRLGTPTWDFSKSWATTITTVGALLGSVLATQGLTGVNMQEGLNLFFGMIVLIAPLIYTTSAKRLKTEIVGKDNTFQYQGTVLMFLITSALTLWAVSGELVTIATTFYALTNSGTTGAAVATSTPAVSGKLVVFGSPVVFGTPALSNTATASTTTSGALISSQLTLLIFILFLILMIVCTFGYVFKSIPWTLEDQLSDKVSKQNKIEAIRQLSVEAKQGLLDEEIKRLPDEATQQLSVEAKQQLSEKLSLNYEQSIPVGTINAKISHFTQENKRNAEKISPAIKSWSIL